MKSICARTSCSSSTSDSLFLSIQKVWVEEMNSKRKVFVMATIRVHGQETHRINDGTYRQRLFFCYHQIVSFSFSSICRSYETVLDEKGSMYTPSLKGDRDNSKLTLAK
ncbi:hypothetical protein TNCV_3392171 [Trichonephila clavipes]|nr:hypothetical protein TNCV_3392171 [Trichonephila clavipes]